MATPIVRRPLKYYLDLRYPVVVYEDPEGGYVAEIPDLPGCLTQAETLPELFELIEDARRTWLEIAYGEGDDIPLPQAEAKYSGKFIVRAPASLHRRLARAAEQEATSLNQYVVQLLAGRVDLDVVLRHIDALGNPPAKTAGSRIVTLAELLEAYNLRAMGKRIRAWLRSKYGTGRGRWQWRQDDPELREVRALIETKAGVDKGVEARSDVAFRGGQLRRA